MESSGRSIKPSTSHAFYFIPSLYCKTRSRKSSGQFFIWLHTDVEIQVTNDVLFQLEQTDFVFHNSRQSCFFRPFSLN